MNVGKTIENAIESAKEKLGSLNPFGASSTLTTNDVLKFLGVQLLEKSGSRLLTTPVLLAFGAGLATGAGGALLFAPKSGRDTRKAIAAWFRTAASTVKAKAEDVAEDVTEAAHDVADNVEDLAERANRKLNGRNRSSKRDGGEATT
jgi:gas vesicle protein